MEEEINREPIVRNELLANDLEPNNGETDNFPSRNLSLQTTLSFSVFLRYPSRTPNPTRNDVFKLDRIGKQVLKLSQSSRKNDIKLVHHHNQKRGTNESIVQWNINGLRNDFEELKILTEERKTPRKHAYKKRTLNRNNKQFFI
jgi:hypothetical protein